MGRPALFIAAFHLSAGLVTAAGPDQVLLFDSGRDGYGRYRIPSLIVTPSGTVLALCEGRKNGGGLTGDIDLVARRSTDSGKSWSPLEVIADDGANTLGNPCAVVDRSTKTVWLAYTRSLGSDTEEHPAGPGRRNLTVRVSFDDGGTWPIAKRLREGDAQYSCLAKLPDGSIGCLYDCWENGNYRLFFVRFELSWLTDD